MASEPRPSRERPNVGSSASSGRRLASLSGLAVAGTELGLTIAVLCLLGWWLDGQWSTSPLMLLLLGGIGVIGTFYKLFRTSSRYFTDEHGKHSPRDHGDGKDDNPTP